LARLRPERYAFFQRLDADGVLLASGQVLDGDLGDGILVLRASSVADAEALLDGDPLVTAGLVTQRRIAQWHPTIGAWVSH